MNKKKKYVALYSAINDWTVPIEAENKEDAFCLAEKALDNLYEEGPFDYSEDVGIDIYEVDDEEAPDFEDWLESIIALIHFIRDNSDMTDRMLERMVCDGRKILRGED